MEVAGPEHPELADPRFAACVDFVGRIGAESFSIRYSDEPTPVVWIAAVTLIEAMGGGSEAAAGMTPLTALYRLCEQVADGGFCVHCKRPTGITDDWTGTMPLEEHICWYRFDPETEKFARGCSGDVPRQKLRRNDPCPCGSGLKFKRCHGRGPDRTASDRSAGTPQRREQDMEKEEAGGDEPQEETTPAGDAAQGAADAAQGTADAASAADEPDGDPEPDAEAPEPTDDAEPDAE